MSVSLRTHRPAQSDPTWHTVYRSRNDSSFAFMFLNNVSAVTLHSAFLGLFLVMAKPSLCDFTPSVSSSYSSPRGGGCWSPGGCSEKPSGGHIDRRSIFTYGLL